MNAAENTALATDAKQGDAMLDDLLSSLDTGADPLAAAGGIDHIIATDAAAGVPGMNDLMNDLTNLDDALLETIEGGTDAGVIEAKGADTVITDPVEEIIDDAAIGVSAPDAVPETAPTKSKKGAAKKSGAKKGGKKTTTVPPGYGSDSKEEQQPDAGMIETKGEGDDAPAPAAVPEAPKEPKPLRATSVTHKPGDLLVAKLGTDNAAALLIFDDRHDGEQIQEAHADFIAKMNLGRNESGAIADKVQDKAIMLFTWLAKGGALNEVMRRTFEVLHKDGQITGGAKGNLHLSLLAKPYSPGTAASQGNQMFMLLPLLQITLKEKGRMIPNPHSPLLAMINAGLGLK